MALKRWHRAGILAAVLALGAIAILPPRPMPEPGTLMGFVFGGDFARWGFYRPHQFTLSATLDDLRNRHRAAVMADSLLALTRGGRAVRSTDNRITVLFEPGLTADSARVWLAMFERELALMPRAAEPGVPIVVALRSTALGPDRPRGQRVVPQGPIRDWSAIRFVSPRPEQQACVVALRVAPLKTGEKFDPSSLIQRDNRTGLARTAALDWCLMFATFGIPGPSVSRWVGHRVDVRPWWSPTDNMSLALKFARQPRSANKDSVGPEEVGQYWSDPMNTGCLRGARILCLKSVGLMSDPTLRDDRGWIAYMRRSFLVSLALEDPGRFGRFWRSSGSAERALEQAWGKPASSLIAEWRRSMLPVQPTGPRAEISALLSSLGWAAVLLGVGFVLAMRREVDA